MVTSPPCAAVALCGALSGLEPKVQPTSAVLSAVRLSLLQTISFGALLMVNVAVFAVAER